MSSDWYNELNKLSTDHGWRKALSVFLNDLEESNKEVLKQEILNDSRADWKYMISLEGFDTAVELGCDGGATSCSLARSFKRVFAVSTVRQRIRFLHSRLSEDGVGNVLPIFLGSDHLLPFQDSSADLFYINWYQLLQGTQLKAQNLLNFKKCLLKEVHRGLNANGKLFFFETRRSVSCRLINRRPSSGLTGHSPKEIFLLLKETGFRTLDFFFIYPNAYDFHWILPMKDQRLFRESLKIAVSTIPRRSAALKGVFLDWLTRCHLLGIILEDFAIVAEKY